MQVSQPLTVSFGRFTPPDDSQAIQGSRTARGGGDVPNSTPLATTISTPDVADLILSELRGTAFYDAIKDIIINVGIPDSAGNFQGSQTIHEGRGVVTEQGSERKRTHFGRMLRGEAWKYSTICQDVDVLNRECRFCHRKFKVKYHQRYLQHLLGFTPRMPCTIPPIEVNQLLQTSVTARKMKHRFELEGVSERASVPPPDSSSIPSLLPHSQPATQTSRGVNRRHTSSGSSRGRGESLVWTDELRDKFVQANMKVIVLRARPFNFFEKLSGKFNSPERELLELVCPGIESHLPSSGALATNELMTYHGDMYKHIAKHVKDVLTWRFGTLMFDSWEDIKRQSVVNVMLKIDSGVPHAESMPFLSRTEYVGSRKPGALEYFNTLQRTVEQYGMDGRICAVTSDNEQSCINARRMFTEAYGGSWSVNDQSHVADLIIENVAELDWMEDVIESVSHIVSTVHSHKKLKNRLAECVEEFNGLLRRGLKRKETDLRQADHDPEQMQVLEQNLIKIRALHRPAIMVEQISETRFASAERMLGSFLRARPALFKVIGCTAAEKKDFESNLYRVPAQRRDSRKRRFVDPLLSPSFLADVAKVHSVVRVFRRYLSLFDADSSQIFKVLLLTMELEKEIERLPIDEYKKRQVMAVYLRQRDGPVSESTKVLLLQDVYWVAHILDPNSDLSGLPEQVYKEKLRNEITRYCAGKYGDIRQRSLKVEQMMGCFEKELSSWEMMKLSNQDIGLKYYQGKPLQYWNSSPGGDQDFRDFARRVLSCPPSATAVERSFSAFKRIHTRLRNRLKNEKASLMYCYWNLRVQLSAASMVRTLLWDEGAIGHDENNDQVSSLNGSRTGRQKTQLVSRSRRLEDGASLVRRTVMMVGKFQMVFSIYRMMMASIFLKRQKGPSHAEMMMSTAAAREALSLVNGVERGGCETHEGVDRLRVGRVRSRGELVGGYR